MSPRVVLKVSKGAWQGKEFAFGGRCKCLIGRALNCTIHLPSEPGDLEISRHHCLIDIDLPEVRVRDCGSLNGTYLNGRDIGHRPKGKKPQEAAGLELPSYPVKDGDELQVGETVFRVGIVPSETGEQGAEHLQLEALCL